MRHAIAAISILLSLVTAGVAQNFRGGINGIVADQTGAVVANAQVKATNEATGVANITTASTAGEFSFEDLPLGSYTITVSQSGFSTVSVTGVRVTAGTVYNLPVTLGVATVATSVEVSAAALSVETTNTTIISALPTVMVQDLPMNARDYTQMIGTVPGWAGNSSNGLSGSLNGMRQNQINWQMDGTDNNDPWWNFPATNQTGVSSIAAAVVPLDAIEEFNLVTQGNAEMGRSPGGTVNLIFKSGTNALHGTAYDYERNEALAARPPFLAANKHKPVVRNRNYGFSAGGPIKKDKTFFFTTYEAQKYILSAAAYTTEPTLAYQAEALNLLNQYGVPVNPLTKTLLNTLWPSYALTGATAANNPGASNNYLADTPQTGYSHNGIIKIDHSFNDRYRLSLRAFDSYSFQIGSIGDNLPYYYAVTPVHSQNYNATLNTVVNPHLTNQLLFGSNYFDLKKQDQNPSFNPVALGLNTGVSGNPALSGSPAISIGSFDPIGSTPKVGRDTVAVSGTDVLSYIKGTHQLRIGGAMNQGRIDGFYRAGERGNFSFNGLQGPWKSMAIDNNILSLADFLAGYVYQSSIAVGNPERFVTMNGFNFFVHDSWQVSRKLNVNYGLRYEYTGPLHDSAKDLSEFDPSVPGGLAVAGEQIPNLYQRYWKNFLPRGGFAYQPTGRGDLVIRGGIGLYIDTVPILPFLNNSNSLASYGAPNGGPIGVNGNPAGTQPVYKIVENNYTIVPNQLLFPSVPTISGTNVINLFGVNYDLRPAMILGFNLNVEKGLGKNVLLQVGYVGMESRHLITLQDINQPALGSGTALLPSGFTKQQASRPYFSEFPNFGVINTVESNGDANYNSLQTQVKTTTWHGLFTKANFTWSHNLDDMTSNSGTLPQNSFNLLGNYGNSDNDRALQFSADLVYQVPGSHYGPAWLSHGWELSSIMIFHSGPPITPKATDTTGTGEGVLYANYIGGDPYATGSHAVVNAQPVQWLNPAAFAAPPAGTYGTIGRGMIFGPGFGSVDLSILKTIPIKERVRAQFHVDIFNLLNRTNLSGVSSTVGTSAFGTVSSTTGGTGAPGIGVGEPFNIQLALKILW
jgi:hypothetical protein